MKNLPNAPRRGLRLLLASLAVWSLGHGPVARANPPAPYYLLSGMARDQYGTPISSVNAYVVLQTQAGVKLTTRIIPGLAAGINYQIKVPMDAGQTAQLYRPDALLAATPYTMLIVLNGATNVPIEMQGNLQVMGQPGGSSAQNLTLGTDANGDGIPDAWETAYMQTLGLNLPLSSLHAGTILSGKQTLLQAYLLGLPVFNPGTPFQVTMIKSATGSPVIQFPAMTGRSYTVLGSTDLNTWTPLTFNLPTDAPGTAGRTFFYSTSIQDLQLQVNLPNPAVSAMYLKVLLQ